jgi:hypothetical protein
VSEFGKSSFFEDTDEPQEPKNFGFYWGIVKNNQDPDNRGRVRIQIPGLIETESTWAEPVGAPGGGTSHGMFAVPKVNAPVVVGFIQGDIDEPFYMAGPQRDTEEVDDAHPDNIVVQSDNFRILMDNRDGQRVLRLENLRPDVTDQAVKDVVQSFIEITLNGGDNGTTQAVRIHSASSMALTAAGGIAIDAGVVTIKGRAVQPTPKDI